MLKQELDEYRQNLKAFQTTKKDIMIKLLIDEVER